VEGKIAAADAASASPAIAQAAMGTAQGIHWQSKETLEA
jgi:hypothetical protein